jgi:hypothetical protein
VGFFNNCINFFIGFLYIFLSKMFICFLSLLVSRFLMHMLKFCLLLCSSVLILIF